MAFLACAPVVICIAGQLLADYCDSLREAGDPAEALLAADIRKLNAEIAKLSPVADFVAVSKKQRDVCKLEKALAAARAQGKKESSGRANIARILRWGVLPILQLIIVLLFWGQTVALLPSGWFSWFFVVQQHSEGVGLIAWLAIVNVAAPNVASQVSLLVGLRSPSPPATVGNILSSVMSKIM